jgi:hypothetical protein
MMSRRSLESGQVQGSLLVVFVVALALGYLGWALYPAITDEMYVRQSLHAIANEGWHHGGRSDLHKQVMDKLATIGTHLETPADGPARAVQGLGVQDDDVVVSCTDRTQDCTDDTGEVQIQVRYQRVMPLPFLTDKSITLHFSPHADATLKSVNW